MDVSFLIIFYNDHNILASTKLQQQKKKNFYLKKAPCLNTYLIADQYIILIYFRLYFFDSYVIAITFF